MNLRLVVISTPIGFIGSGRGGGVELTLVSIIAGLLELGNEVTLVTSEGSILPSSCNRAQVITVSGTDQESWQHQDANAPMRIPLNAILPKLLDKALNIGKDYDAIINLSYDWLPLWVTPYVDTKIFHLISMGGVSNIMIDIINKLSKTNHNRLAFHTYSQASDYKLADKAIVLGNGFNMKNYNFQLGTKGPLGWAGRISPEKGLEDAAEVASSMGDKLLVWGFVEDKEYASKIEASVAPGTIQWRGFLSTKDFQKELGSCRAFINTPKWNEAFGNVVIEAMACGVPVIAYNRGGPGELVKPGFTGWLVPPDDIEKLKIAVSKVDQIDRTNCREWAIKTSSQKEFAGRILSWVVSGIADEKI